jgi:RNA polymerase sigma-70 factor (ECF subfamily)
VTGPDAAAADPFVAERSRLWGVAYRITGSRADADDVVQDAWLRWHGADHGAIERPAAWLTTVTSRLALDRLRARARDREVYLGPWLPEPFAAPSARTPEEAVELADSLTYGFLVLLERLEPLERVVFLLADVFGEPFAAISEVVDRSEPACRQIARRARERVRRSAPRRAVGPREPGQLAGAFARAAQDGDVEGLTRLLSDDVVMITDGGRDHRAARHPIVGPDRVGPLVVNLARRLPPDGTREVTTIDGDEAIVVRVAGRATLAVVLVTDADDQAIESIYAIVNLAKLDRL